MSIFNLEEHLPRVQNAIGVEDFFDVFHNFERWLIDRHVKIRGFDVADAVFAGDGAAEGDGEGEGFADAFARAPDGFGVVAVDDKIYVDVAVAGVSEIGDEGVVLAPDLFDL